MDRQAREIAKYESLSSGYREEKETLQKEYDEYQSLKAREIKELNTKIAYLFQQLSTLRSSHADEIGTFSQELKSVVDDSRRELDSLRMECHIVQNQLDDKTALISSRDHYIQELKDKVGYL